MQRFISVVLLLFLGWIAPAQELNTILEKHFRDYGQSLWDQMNTVVVDGYWVSEDFRKNPIKLTYKSPSKIRLEGSWKGQRFVQASNGLVAWEVVPWSPDLEMRTMPTDELLFLTHLYQLGSPLARYASQLVLEGLESVEGELMIKLRYENESEKHFFYLGKDDYRLYLERIEMKDNPDLILEKRFNKYKSFHGLLAPTSVRVLGGAFDRDITLGEITLGAGASDALFEWHKGQ